jgi:hypothetical protein
MTGAVGLVMAPRGRLFLVLGVTISDGRITAIDVIGNPGRLGELDLAVLDSVLTRLRQARGPLQGRHPRIRSMAERAGAAQPLALLRGEGGDEDEPDDVRGVGGSVRDDRTSVRVADHKHRPGNLVEEAGHVGGVDGDAAQRIRGRRHLEPGGLQALDDAVPARGVGEGAVDENDGEGAVLDVVADMRALG